MAEPFSCRRMWFIPLLGLAACGHVTEDARPVDDTDAVIAQLVSTDRFAELFIDHKIPVEPSWECEWAHPFAKTCVRSSDRRISAHVTLNHDLIDKISVSLARPEHDHDGACRRLGDLHSELQSRLGAASLEEIGVCKRPEPLDPNIGDGACVVWRRGESQAALGLVRSVDDSHFFSLELRVESIHYLEPICGKRFAN